MSTSRSPILFRCDGTPELGWEAFYQGLLFASAMQRRRRGTYMLSQLEPNGLALPIQRGGHEWVAARHPVGSAEDVDQTLAQARRLNAAAVVVSSHQVSEGYLRELTAGGLLVMTFDDAAAFDFPNRLVVHPYMGLSREKYSLARGTQFLGGARYSLIRPLIRRLRPLRAQEPPLPFRALVAMGDDDLTGQSLPLAQQLLGFDALAKVDVMVRLHHPQYRELKELAGSKSGRLDIVTEPSEISTRIGRAHFAISSGDGVSLELACLGVPQLIVGTESRHEANGQRLDEEGAATWMGRAEDLTSSALEEAVEILLTDPMERQGMSRRGRQVIDGRGPDRLVTALEMLLHVGVQGQRMAA